MYYLLIPGIPAGWLIIARATYGYQAWDPCDDDTHGSRMTWSVLWPVFWLLTAVYTAGVATGRFISAGWQVRETGQRKPVTAGPEPEEPKATCAYEQCTETAAEARWCSEGHREMYWRTRNHRRANHGYQDMDRAD